MGRRKQSGSESSEDREAAQAGGLKAKRRSTPDERRGAVEEFEKSGLTQATFARHWGISHVTLGVWVRRHRSAGPTGLERLAEGPPQRRGKAPLPEALKAEIVAAQQEHPTFGWKRLKAWLWRFVGVKVSRSSVARVVKAAGVARDVAPPRRRVRRKAKPVRRFERARPGTISDGRAREPDMRWRRPVPLGSGYARGGRLTARSHRVSQVLFH